MMTSIETMVRKALFGYGGIFICFTICEAGIKLPDLSRSPVPTTLPSPGTRNGSDRPDLRGTRVAIHMHQHWDARRILDNSSNSHRFRYRDGHVMDAFQKVTGCTFEVKSLKNCDFNVSCPFTEEIIKGFVDLTFNVITPRSQVAHLDFTSPVMYYYIILVTPRISVTNGVLELAGGVETKARLVLGGIVAVAALVWQASYPMHVRPNLLQATSKGVLIDNMTNIRYERDINTLQELDDSGYQIFASDVYYIRTLPDADSDLLKSLKSKIKMYLVKKDESKLMVWLLKSRRVAMITNDYSFRKNARLLRGGMKNFHVVEEYPFMHYVVYPLLKGSPYNEWMRTLVGWLVQSGLPDYWSGESHDRFGGWVPRNMSEILQYSKAEPVKTIHLRDLISVFLLLGFGHSIAVIIIILEIIVSKEWLQKIRWKS